MSQPIQDEGVPLYGVDVVCGMELLIKGKMLKSMYQDKTYYFCSANCQEHFDNSPERYAV